MSEVFRFSNRGGVYKAVDNLTGRDVVIKEARPHVQVGIHRVDAIPLLEKEFRLLKQLEGTKYFVKPVHFFFDGEHAFLVEEFFSGDHIGRFCISQNPLYHHNVTTIALNSYFSEMRKLWLQISLAIEAAHKLGIVLGDISFTNILINEESNIQIIDLECAIEEGVDQQVGLYTPGTTSYRTRKTGISDPANDYYALGSIIFGSIMLANSIKNYFPPAGPRFLKELSADVGLPEDLVQIIEDLMDPQLPELSEQIINRINQLTFEIEKPRVQTVRLEQPAIERLGRKQRVALQKQVGDTITATIQYICGVADVKRDDRLFPADLTVFETNPLSIAFGAAGVLYAVHRITGDVPKHLLDWFLRRKVSNEVYPPGLYMGQSGIAWVLNELGYTEVALQIMRSARRHELLFNSPNILYGSAGYGLACLKLWTAGLGEEFLDEAVRISKHLINSAVHDEHGMYWLDENGEVSIGYAYGGSGIALFLLYQYLASGDRLSLNYGKQALEFELFHGSWSNGKFLGFPAIAVDESEKKLVIPRCYWDAGSAGVITTLIRYLAVFPDDIDLQNWLPHLSLDVSHKYTVMPQLFHGLAGLGNALLDIWEQFDDERYLSDAWQVAEGILLFRIDKPEGIGFAGEQSSRESADFATGSAGIALFLDRLQKAESGIRGNFNFVIDELLPKS